MLQMAEEGGEEESFVQVHMNIDNYDYDYGHCNMIILVNMIFAFGRSSLRY